MHETRTLARFVAETQFTDLPHSLLEDCKIMLLDTLTAGIIGTAQPWAQQALRVVQQLGGTPEASIIQQDWQTDRARAAFANGVLIGAFECEPLTGSHASGTVLPAALAVCQHEHFSGQAFLTAMALGYEISARIARTAVGLESVRGFHNPGTQGPFGAAAAVGKLYGGDQAMLTNALGLAGSCSAGLLEFAWHGADTKRLHLGRASQLGLESALLAQQGLHGPATVLEGRYGYFNAFSQPANLQRLVAGLGTTWAIQPPSLKSYATHVTHQAVVQTVQDFKRDIVLDPALLTRVVIRGAPRLMEERHSEREPVSVLGGQYSLPFTTAVALSRDLAQPLQYNDAAIRDPVVRDLAKRIELVPVPDWAEQALTHAEVLIEYNGHPYTLPTRPYKGSPLNPFTWPEVSDKFRSFTAPFVSTTRADTLIAAVHSLEHIDDMTRIALLLIPGNKAVAGP